MQQTELTVIEIIEINPPKPEAELAPKAPEPEPAPRKPYLCRHIFVDGRQCGSRALRDQNFCYYHYAHRTPVLAHQRRRQPAPGFDISRLDGLDNHTSIQLALSEVLGRIANKTIELKYAGLLLHGLRIAAQNLRYSRCTTEAPIPDTIVEDLVHGQLAQLEEGRSEPEGSYSALLATKPYPTDQTIPLPDFAQDMYDELAKAKGYPSHQKSKTGDSEPGKPEAGSRGPRLGSRHRQTKVQT